MRASVLLSALVGLVAATPIASPNPQDINIDEIIAAPEPSVQGPPLDSVSQAPTYNPIAAAASAAAAIPTDLPVARRLKRDVPPGCGPLQPGGYGPPSSPDTDDGFHADNQWAVLAEKALVPQGYAQTFSNRQGSVEGNGYLGFYTMSSFDTIKCQQYCDATVGCYGINVFVERDPKYDPTADCKNPVSVTNYKCSLWGYAITDATATNKGGYRYDFHVVIAGSNGYTKLAPPPGQPGFSGPAELGGAINAPSGYMGMKYYAGNYDPGLCSSACTATTAYDRRHPKSTGAYDACNFFNSYVLSKNNVPQGTYCSLYTQAWARSYATNYGQYRGSDYYSISQSYAYTLTPQDPGHI